jgi:hypothetical protein
MRCDYVVLPPGGPLLPAGRYDRAAVGPVAEALAAGLAAAFGDELTLYVLRQVEASVALPGGADPVTDRAAARRWGGGLAAAVTRAVHGDSGDGSNLVRFADQAEYTAGFLADLLAGTAWQHWYYGAFERCRLLPVGRAVAEVLAAEGPAAAQVLAALHRCGGLDAVLAVLPEPAGLAELLLGAASTVDGRRVVAAAAVRIAGELRLWAGAPVPLAEVAASCPPPAAVDWRSRTGLTAAVLDVLGQLRDRGALRPVAGPLQPPAGLDWLDPSALAAALARPPFTGRSEPAPPHRAEPRPTPRRRALLTALAAVIGAALPELRAAGPGDVAALRILAALVDEAPEWSGDPLATVTIRRIIDAWATAVPSVATAVPTRPSAVPAGPAAGPAAAASTEAGLAALLAAAAPAGPEPGWASPYAGILLLTRAVADVNLRRVLHRALDGDRPDAFQATVIEVASRLLGAPDSGPLDPAIAVFAGLPPEPPAPRVAELRHFWRRLPAAHAVAVERAVGETGTALRLDSGPPGTDAAADGPSLIAAFLLRAWARWLRGFEQSSAPYLVEQFLRRPGRIRCTPDAVEVTLEPRPLDVVLTNAGYTRSIEAVPWLDGRPLHVRLGG